MFLNQLEPLNLFNLIIVGNSLKNILLMVRLKINLDLLASEWTFIKHIIMYEVRYLGIMLSSAEHISTMICTLYCTNN